MLWSVPLTLRSRERHSLFRAAAVPDGSVCAWSQVEWREAARYVLEALGLRADGLATALAIVDALANHADWDTMLSRPTHAELARAAGCSTRTVARYRAVLEAGGLVGIVTPGRTSDPVDPDAGRLAQAYVLTLPEGLSRLLRGRRKPTAGAPTDPGGRDDVADQARPAQGPPPGPVTDPAQPLTSPDGPMDENVTPSCPTSGGTDAGSTPTRAGASGRARYARGGQPQNRPEGARCDDLGRGACWSTTAVPATREQRRLAAAQAWRIDPVLRRVSPAHVAALCREWHLAGWTIADLRHALVQRPDDHPEGPAWPHNLVAADVRHVPGWVRHRLAAWRTNPSDPASPPAASPSQRRAADVAAAAAAHAAALATDRATRAAQVAAADVETLRAARAAAAARTAARATATAATRHAPPTALTQPHPPATPTPGATPSTSSPAAAAARPGDGSVPRPTPPAGPPTAAADGPVPPAAAPGGRAVPVPATADPRIAALRAAARARRR